MANILSQAGKIIVSAIFLFELERKNSWLMKSVNSITGETDSIRRIKVYWVTFMDYRMDSSGSQLPPSHPPSNACVSVSPPSFLQCGIALEPACVWVCLHMCVIAHMHVCAHARVYERTMAVLRPTLVVYLRVAG